ncbi:hypothetical protein G6F40_014594 [Rhizopus arrhizus]|nr:hypothetical protein G6F40_014594 [Rhizopus arrhizus]
MCAAGTGQVEGAGRPRLPDRQRGRLSRAGRGRSGDIAPRAGRCQRGRTESGAHPAVAAVAALAAAQR